MRKSICKGIYSEVILREADGCCVVVGGLNSTNIRYADDTVLLASSERELHHLLDVVNEKCTVSYANQRQKDRSDGNIENPRARYSKHLSRWRSFENSRSFVYLGSKLSVDGRSHEDICNRMSQTKSAFFKMKSLLCNPKLDSGIRFRLWRCSVLPILLHGCESRTIRETDRRKLAARIDPQPLKFSRDWERARELVADVKWYGTQRRKKEFKIHSVETVSEVIHESKVKFVT